MVKETSLVNNGARQRASSNMASSRYVNHEFMDYTYII